MYINKRIHSNNIRLRENLEVPTCRTATYYVPFTIDLSTLGTRLVQTQEIVKRSLALRMVQNWNYVTKNYNHVGD